MNNKTIHYFKLSITQKDVDSKKYINLTQQDIFKLFEEIYNNKTSYYSNPFKSLFLKDENLFFDFLYFNENHVFIKVGKRNPSSSIEVKDEQSFESSNVHLEPTQQLHIITYILIDFQKCIVSILTVNGAPTVSALKKLIYQCFSQSDLNVYISAILTKDIIKKIVNKDYLGSFELSIAVPNNDLLHDEFVLSRSMFDKIQNLNQITITSRFGIKRNRNAFLTGNDILDFFSETQEKHGPALKRFYVSAKDEGEKSKKYNLLEYKITSKVELSDLNFTDFDIIYRIMNNEYEKIKSQLLELVQIHI